MTTKKQTTFIEFLQVLGSHCYLAMGQHLKVPVVGVVTSAMWPWVNDIVANPDDPAFIPHVFFEADGKMNFLQRLENTITLFYEKSMFNYFSAGQDKAIRKYIGDHVSGVRDAERNVSLILVNSHFTVHGVRPFTTAVVEVGGLHIPPNSEPLPSVSIFHCYLDSLLIVLVSNPILVHIY